jgi:transposase-like protein
VARPDFPRTIIEFQHRFPDEDACRQYLFESRWPEGFRCPRCGSEAATGLPRRLLWQCSACRYQVSVTAGTVLHRTRTPLHLWFWAAYLVTTAMPGISALQLQRQLGLKRYETSWTMLHKLRRAMVNPEREPLTGVVEVDECFVGGHEPGLRGGRQQGIKALVIVAVEVRGAGSGPIRMQVIDDASADTLCDFVAESIAAGATVRTDGWSGYKRLARLGFDHQPRSQRAHHLLGEDPDEILPRVHRVIRPQSLAAGHPPRRQRGVPAGLPRRVHLPLQPPTHAHGRFPESARPREPAGAHHPRRDPGRGAWRRPARSGVQRISMTTKYDRTCSRSGDETTPSWPTPTT